MWGSYNVYRPQRGGVTGTIRTPGSGSGYPLPRVRIGELRSAGRGPEWRRGWGRGGGASSIIAGRRGPLCLSCPAVNNA